MPNNISFIFFICTSTILPIIDYSDNSLEISYCDRVNNSSRVCNSIATYNKLTKEYYLMGELCLLYAGKIPDKFAQSCDPEEFKQISKSQDKANFGFNLLAKAYQEQASHLTPAR